MTDQAGISLLLAGVRVSSTREATVRSLGPQACLADNTQKRIAWRVSAPVPVPETS